MTHRAGLSPLTVQTKRDSGHPGKATYLGVPNLVRWAHSHLALGSTSSQVGHLHSLFQPMSHPQTDGTREQETRAMARALGR